MPLTKNTRYFSRLRNSFGNDYYGYTGYVDAFTEIKPRYLTSGDTPESTQLRRTPDNLLQFSRVSRSYTNMASEFIAFEENPYNEAHENLGIYILPQSGTPAQLVNSVAHNAPVIGVDICEDFALFARANSNKGALSVLIDVFTKNLGSFSLAATIDLTAFFATVPPPMTSPGQHFYMPLLPCVIAVNDGVIICGAVWNNDPQNPVFYSSKAIHLVWNPISLSFSFDPAFMWNLDFSLAQDYVFADIWAEITATEDKTFAVIKRKTTYQGATPRNVYAGFPINI